MQETITRTEINGLRYYKVTQGDDVIGTFPSVTTILGETSDKGWLIQWQNRVGLAVANQIGKDSTDRGTVMHRLCEIYLNLPMELSKAEKLNITLELSRTDAEINKFDTRAIIVGGSLFYKYINANSFDDITSVIAQEKFLWTNRELGYAGTLDNLSLLNDGTYAIIDFKSAKRPKTLSQIEDYKLQVSAYSIAVWDRLNIKATTCKILISSETAKMPQEFIMTPKDTYEYYNKFKIRLNDFYNKHKPIETNEFK